MRSHPLAMLRSAVLFGALLALLGGPVAAHPRQTRVTVGPATAAPEAGSRVPGPANIAAPRGPAAGDSSRGKERAVREELQSALASQAAALLGGDQAKFLAVADAGLAGELRRRFTVLRAMQVAGWDESLTDTPKQLPGTDQWRSTVRLRYCFVVAGCTPVAVDVETRWADRGGRLKMVYLGTSTQPELGPRPWEVSDLRIAIGPRVVLAATPRYAGRLAGSLAAAEKAAAVADRYARWGAPPDRYLVYLADADEWRQWYGVSQPTWVAGYAMPVTDDATEIILNGQKVGTAEIVDTLRHEFSHVVTLAGVRRSYTDRWWLVEGIAEYVRMAGRSVSSYAGLELTRQYVHGGQWSGEVTLGDPSPTTSVEEANGRYGVAFLAVRCLAERYGEDQMLAFFDAVVRRGGDQDSAAVAQFGGSLGAVAADCAGYVRAAVG
jgi:hypothetical protein